MSQPLQTITVCSSSPPRTLSDITRQINAHSYRTNKTKRKQPPSIKEPTKQTKQKIAPRTKNQAQTQEYNTRIEELNTEFKDESIQEINQNLALLDEFLADEEVLQEKIEDSIEEEEQLQLLTADTDIFEPTDGDNKKDGIGEDNANNDNSSDEEEEEDDNDRYFRRVSNSARLDENPFSSECATPLDSQAGRFSEPPPMIRHAYHRGKSDFITEAIIGTKQTRGTPDSLVFETPPPPDPAEESNEELVADVAPVPSHDSILLQNPLKASHAPITGTPAVTNTPNDDAVTSAFRTPALVNLDARDLIKAPVNGIFDTPDIKTRRSTIWHDVTLSKPPQVFTQACSGFELMKDLSQRPEHPSSTLAKKHRSPSQYATIPNLLNSDRSDDRLPVTRTPEQVTLPEPFFTPVTTGRGPRCSFKDVKKSAKASLSKAEEKPLLMFTPQVLPAADIFKEDEAFSSKTAKPTSIDLKTPTAQPAETIPTPTANSNMNYNLLTPKQHHSPSQSEPTNTIPEYQKSLIDRLDSLETTVWEQDALIKEQNKKIKDQEHRLHETEEQVKMMTGDMQILQNQLKERSVPLPTSIVSRFPLQSSASHAAPKPVRTIRHSRSTRPTADALNPQPRDQTLLSSFAVLPEPTHTSRHSSSRRVSVIQLSD